jgi:hypothetical protein
MWMSVVWHKSRLNLMATVAFFVFPMAAHSSNDQVNVVGRSESPSSAVALPGLSTRTESNKSLLFFGMETALLEFSTTSLYGLGARIGFEHGLSERWSVNVNGSFVTDPMTQKHLYTGLGGMFRYSVTGSFNSFRHEVLQHGGKVVSQNLPRQERLFVGGGIEQLMLTASQGVLPATGFMIAGGYSFQLASHWTEVSVRSASLSTSKSSLFAYFLTWSLSLDL